MSEANSHEHWRVRQKRARAQKETAFFIAAPWVVNSNAWVDLITPKGHRRAVLFVTLTRIAPRGLDSDNLVGAPKHVRDGIAAALGIDDRDPRVCWEYAQERGKPGEYAVRVQIWRVQ